MLFLNAVLVLSLATSGVFGARVQAAANRDRRLHCNGWGTLCQGAQENPKIRRGGAVGLFPFPRVGRSQPERTWMLTPQEYSEMHHEMKRQGLIPFPRVGRAMIEPGARMMNGDAGGGMWFGPRLGRFSKKNIFGYDDEDQWNVAAMRDFAPSHLQDELLLQDAQEQEQLDSSERVRQKRSS